MGEVVTKSARRASRLVWGGQRELVRQKRRAHRRRRRQVREALSRGQHEFFFSPSVTARDIA